MNKSMLYVGLMTFLSTAVCAEEGVNDAQIAPLTVNSQIQQVAMPNTEENSPLSSLQNQQIAAAANQAMIVAGCKQILADANKNLALAETSPPAMPATELESPTPISFALAETTTVTQTPATAPITTTPAATTPAATTPAATTPAATTPAATTPAAATPAATTPAAATAPGATTPATSTTTTITTTTSAAPSPQTFDCKYRIPAETVHVDQNIVLKWAEKAAEQSFAFDHTALEKQLSTLKTCYTEQGWQGFNDALQKSGNLNAIKSQQLTVSSMVTGIGKIVEMKENQWKITLPMQVVYQNDKEKLTQPLTVNLVIGRKVSGDLGIMQMIAIPSHNTSETGAGEVAGPTGQ